MVEVKTDAETVTFEVQELGQGVGANQQAHDPAGSHPVS